jgi:GAF domain-containing protein
MEPSELSEKKFSILKEISDTIVITEDIVAIANLMLDLAISYANAEKGSLMLANEIDELHILAARGLDSYLAKTYRTKIGEGIAGTVAMNRRPVLVADIDADEAFRDKKRDHYRTSSFISCPVLSKSRLLGVLNINDKKDGTPFTEDEFVLLQTIANQAAIVIENALLMNQLRTKAAELEEMNRKLIETDVVKTEFITRVSHDLRTPLNSIKGSIYHLQESERRSKRGRNEFYEIISNETGTLISTVENLLNFLRFEDEGRVYRKVIINLAGLLNEVANHKLLGQALARKNIKLDITSGDCKSDIVGDRIKVIQFFINLIEGISYYLDSGDSIRISLDEDESVRVNIALPRRLSEKVQPLLFVSSNVFFPDSPQEKLKLYLAGRIAEGHRWGLHAEEIDDSFLISLSIRKNSRQKVEAVVTESTELFLDFVSELLGLNICSVMFSDEFTRDLTIKSARGLNDEIIGRTRVKLGDSIAGWVALEGKPLLVEDISSDPRFGRRSIPQYNTKSLLSVPLKTGDSVIGVLNLNNKENAEPFTERDLHLACVLAERFSHFIGKLYDGEYREDEYKRFIASFESLLNARKRYRKEKTLIPELMAGIMDGLGATEEEKRLALYISMVYDIGLVLINEDTLRKKDLLPPEVNTIKVHPIASVGLLNHFEFSDDVKKAILHHHEKYDGTGYPDGLKGKEIPFIARVLSVVDAFCAMTTERPYGKALTKEAALEELKKGSGSAYDPAVVGALGYVIEKNEPS